jgi:hypothetical protein
MDKSEAERTSSGITSRGLPLAAGLLVVAVAATLLAVRAGDDESADVLVRAREEMESVGTFRFKMNQALPGARSASPFASVGMEGAVDVDGGLSRFVMTTTGSGLNLRCTMIASDKRLFINVDPSRRAEIGADWIRSDSPTLLAGATFQFRPDRLYRDASRIFTDLERTGTREIRGVRTTRYEGNVDFAAFLPNPGPSPLPTAGFDLDVPVEILVDARGLLHRMTVALKSPQRRSAGFEVTVDFFDYGKPVDIKTPPASAVKEATPQQTATACFPLGSP